MARFVDLRPPIYAGCMSLYTVLSTSKLDAEPRCSACGAGACVSFNWAYTHERGTPEDLKQISLFSLWKQLRRGQLYRCQVCDGVWHLGGDAALMTYVEEPRLDLVLAWDFQLIKLPDSIAHIASLIGPTPPDIYGNGLEDHVTPCGIETIAGEIFETAMICVRREAPIDSNRQFRLGSEISRIYETPFALPVAVRKASSRA